MVQQYGTPEYRLYRQARRYKMSVEQMEKMLSDQGYACKICSQHLELGDRFVVDHNYECCGSSAVRSTCGKCNRAILCHSCNLVVGSLENAAYDLILDKCLAYVGYAANDPDYIPGKPVMD